MDINHIFCSELYLLWLTGVRLLVEGSVLTYIGQDGFKYVVYVYIQYTTQCHNSPI